MHASILRILVLASALPALGQNIIYETAFDSDLGWTLQGNDQASWAVDGAPAIYRSPPFSLNFNDGVEIGGPCCISAGTADSPVIDLSNVSGATTLRFRCWYETEDTCAHDVREVQISNDGFATTLFEHCFDGECAYQSWHRHDLPLDPAWGAISVRFAFDTVDNMWNGGRGWFIDDLLVRECAVPSSFCLAAPNSAGAGGALMGYTGTNVVSLNNLRLHATGCPPNQFALFIYSAGQAQTPLGDGFLCLTSPIHRLYPLAQTGGGTPSHVLDLGSPPSAAGQISPGETWNFQCWYRDPAAGVAGFNLSDGLGVAFCP